MNEWKWTVSTKSVIDHDQNRFAAPLASLPFFARHWYGVAAISIAAAATHVSLFITVIIFINT